MGEVPLSVELLENQPVESFPPCLLRLSSRAARTTRTMRMDPPILPITIGVVVVSDSDSSLVFRADSSEHVHFISYEPRVRTGRQIPAPPHHRMNRQLGDETVSSLRCVHKFETTHSLPVVSHKRVVFEADETVSSVELLPRRKSRYVEPTCATCGLREGWRRLMG